MRSAKGRAIVADGEAWGELWRDHQNRWFREHGIELEVDPIAALPAPHIGPVRMRVAGAEIIVRAEEIRRANEAAAHDPDQVLNALTRHNATFTEREVDRFLGKHLADENERAAVRKQVLENRELVPLYDRTTGEEAGRFTIWAMREQEENALADAAVLAGRRGAAALARAAETALAGTALRADQRAAFDHAVSDGGLKLIEGRAGTGKSHVLGAVRAAHEAAGQRVIGLAPTNVVAQDLKAAGFAEAGTVHAALFALKNGRSAWDRHTVVVVDEAAMLDTRIAGELLAAARGAGAKLVLAGDDRQLASIERGGLFTELAARHGSAEITEITRQEVAWQRQAAQDLAEGRFGAAVAAYDRAGAIAWTRAQDEARGALVEAWSHDTARDPDAKRFVFAYTNRDVDALNGELREVRRARGELPGPEVAFDTKHGRAVFAVGDRVQFTDTDKRAGIYNGHAGTITAIDAATGRLSAVLDAPAGGKGREVAWSTAEFAGFRHGYAGTIYKGQGKTLDHTYLYHTQHWRAAASYVALTRQRRSAQVFVARDTARDPRELAWQMARGEVKAASLAWATGEEAAAARLRQNQAGRDPAAPEARQQRAEDYWRGLVAVGRATQDPLAAEVGAASETRERRQAEEYWRGVMAAGRPRAQDPPAAKVRVELPAPEWLVPPHAGRDGRDSLGRGLDPASLGAAVAADPRVQQARAASQSHLERAYRDPQTAQAKLDELARAAGWTEAAAWLDATPEQLGRRRGRDGMFASPSAQRERVQAIIATRALGDSLRRVGETERQAERQYRATVTAQLERDKVGVPKLSPAAAAALDAVHAARTKPPGEAQDNRAAVARAWEAGQCRPMIAAEIDRFENAAERRLGKEAMTALLWRDGRPFSAPGIETQAATELARGLAAAHHGRREHQRQRAQEEAAEHTHDQQHRARHRGLSLGR